MRILPLTLLLGLAAVATPLASRAQQGVAADEQIVMKQVMTDQRAVYARNLSLSESESRAFWPIYDEYEGKAKKLNDRFVTLLNDYATKYATLTDADAASLLKEKLAIEKERLALKQAYTKKIAKALPARKALRYSQIETRIEMMMQSRISGLIPLAN
jgi:hypothetical protein